jgi:glyoxalase family protein
MLVPDPSTPAGSGLAADDSPLATSPGSILGWHHITLGCRDARRTVDFYTRILGLRFVKKTVNFDDPFSYHLYFGDEIGRPGTVVTCFEWRGMPAGHAGIGGTHHLAWRVESAAAVDACRMWLEDKGIVVQPRRVDGLTAIKFRDPDGVRLEVVAPGSAEPPPAEAPSVHESGLRRSWDHVSVGCSDLEQASAFYGDLLGLAVLPGGAHGPADARGRTWRVGGGRLWLVELDSRQHKRARIGVGQTHHFAMAIQDDATQAEWRERLRRAGVSVTTVMDRVYFRSIYFRDPDGHIVELATLGPGFTVDEQPDVLGRALRLPPWLEGERRRIEGHLEPIAAND